MAVIEQVVAREILDSRGNPTVEVEVCLEDGTIAGSATNLMDCVRVVVQKMQIPLESAVKCAAVNSAKSVGIYDQYGSITPGKKANLVLLKEEDLSTVQVILRGQKL